MGEMAGFMQPNIFMKDRHTVTKQMTQQHRIHEMHEGQKLGPMRPQASVGHFAGEQRINRCVIGPTFMEQAVSCDIFKC
ncbi:MAG TPA: hypothetical protein DIT28_16980 [Oxalobacteraceae bacterium]|nr:hypothetical protein [Oxalobacteraceae bacterium]